MPLRKGHVTSHAHIRVLFESSASLVRGFLIDLKAILELPNTALDADVNITPGTLQMCMSVEARTQQRIGRPRLRHQLIGEIYNIVIS